MPAFMEACITFRDMEDRDYVASKSVNLAKQRDSKGKPLAGIRMDVPTFLMPTFKDLNNYAYIVRRRHGKEARTYVKFDDSEMSLYLEVKLPRAERGLKISPTHAKESIVEWTSSELRELQRDIRSSHSVNLIPLGLRSDRADCSQGASTSPQQWIPPRRDDLEESGR